MCRGQPGVGGRGQQVMRLARRLGRSLAQQGDRVTELPQRPAALGGSPDKRVGLVAGFRGIEGARRRMKASNALPSAEPASAARRASAAAVAMIGLAVRIVRRAGKRRARYGPEIPATPTRQARSVP